MKKILLLSLSVLVAVALAMPAIAARPAVPEGPIKMALTGKKQLPSIIIPILQLTVLFVTMKSMVLKILVNVVMQAAMTLSALKRKARIAIIV